MSKDDEMFIPEDQFEQMVMAFSLAFTDEVVIRDTLAVINDVLTNTTQFPDDSPMGTYTVGELRRTEGFWASELMILDLVNGYAGRAIRHTCMAAGVEFDDPRLLPFIWSTNEQCTRCAKLIHEKAIEKYGTPATIDTAKVEEIVSRAQRQIEQMTMVSKEGFRPEVAFKFFEKHTTIRGLAEQVLEFYTLLRRGKVNNQPLMRTTFTTNELREVKGFWLSRSLAKALATACTDSNVLHCLTLEGYDLDNPAHDAEVKTFMLTKRTILDALIDRAVPLIVRRAAKKFGTPKGADPEPKLKEILTPVLEHIKSR